MTALTIEQVEKAIGSPAAKWEGNCYGVASQVVEKGLVTTPPPGACGAEEGPCDLAVGQVMSPSGRP